MPISSTPTSSTSRPSHVSMRFVRLIPITSMRSRRSTIRPKPRWRSAMKTRRLRSFTQFRQRYPAHPLAYRASLALGQYFFQTGDYDPGYRDAGGRRCRRPARRYRRQVALLDGRVVGSDGPGGPGPPLLPAGRRQLPVYRNRTRLPSTLSPTPTSNRESTTRRPARSKCLVPGTPTPPTPAISAWPWQRSTMNSTTMTASSNEIRRRLPQLEGDVERTRHLPHGGGVQPAP